MKDFLESLEIGEEKVKLSKEEVKSILAEQGKTVTNETEKVKTDLNKEIETYKATISNLESQLENVRDSTELEGLKKEIADTKAKETKRIADEKAKQEDEILTNNIISAFGDKEFTSDYVKNGIITFNNENIDFYNFIEQTIKSEKVEKIITGTIKENKHDYIIIEANNENKDIIFIDKSSIGEDIVIDISSKKSGDDITIKYYGIFNKLNYTEISNISSIN